MVLSIIIVHCYYLNSLKKKTIYGSDTVHVEQNNSYVVIENCGFDFNRKFYLNLFFDHFFFFRHTNFSSHTYIPYVGEN